MGKTYSIHLKSDEVEKVERLIKEGLTKTAAVRKVLMNWDKIRAERLKSLNKSLSSSPKNVPFSIVDFWIIKGVNKSELEIYKIINAFPGIAQWQIRERINLCQATLSYHLCQMVEKKLIRVKCVGREKKYYPLLPYDLNTHK